MPRKKLELWWRHVNKVPYTKKWACRYCNEIRTGSASQIQIHLTRCSGYLGNIAEQVHNPNALPNPDADEPSYDGEMARLKQVTYELERGEHDITMLKARGKKCKPDVDAWLEELKELKATAVSLDISNEIHDITDLINQMKRHQEEAPLSLSTEFIVDSLDMHIEEILRLLADDKVFVIGILGIGGVGKTLLATLVENVVKRKGRFKNVFWLSVSPNFSISNLQSDIAKRIGLKLDEEDEKVRAEELSSALEKTEAVIILNDVWKYIDLDKVGIHPRGKGLKVIITFETCLSTNELSTQSHNNRYTSQLL